MQSLYNDAITSGVKGIVLLNLPEVGFSNEKVIEEAKHFDGFFRVFPLLNPKIRGVLENINRLKNLGASGLKLHPRIHDYHIDCAECVALVCRAGELGIPVMIDGFPDGKNIAIGNLPESFARLAENASSSRIAIGHAGGHRLLDALMVAKYFKNLYLDLSYTLLYYRNSSISGDIAYAIKSIHGERIFWGSDYPDRPYGETVSLSLAEFKKMNLTEAHLLPVMENNARQFLRESV
jgi:predicted TIM-barrel fold metal-dependent hydrolase